MPTSSNSSALQIIDSIAIAIAQGYILARARLTSHPSPVLRLAAARDAVAWDAALLERELTVFRQERERIPAKQRPHYTPTHRLEIQVGNPWTKTQAAAPYGRGSIHCTPARVVQSPSRSSGFAGDCLVQFAFVLPSSFPCLS